MKANIDSHGKIWKNYDGNQRKWLIKMYENV